MYYLYKKDESIIWPTPNNRLSLRLEQINAINNRLRNFCNNWNTHGKPVSSSFKLYNWFICLFINEDKYATSGCSIDTSVSLIKSIGKQHEIDFFNRKNVLFLENKTTKILPLSEFKLIIKSDIIIYNNMVKNKFEFEK